MKRNKLFILLLLLAVLFALAACTTTGGEEGGETTGEGEEEGGEATEELQLTCALITPNPLGDRSFIDSSARGVERINEELAMHCDIIETNGVAEHETALRGAIQQGYDVIMGLAMDAAMFISLAEEFPDQKFGSPSEVFADDLPANLVAYQIDVHESSFLVGLIVGSLTETKIVGAVVGGDAPALNQFFYGYKQGVLEVCPDCEVLVSYLGFEFSNPTLGLETALSQYELGADIIYQVAGRSGEGVLEAAAQTGNYAIGVDSNQDFIQPGHVIVSMIKRVDVTTFLIAQSVVDGTYAGGFQALGLADGAAGLSWDEGSTTFEEEGPEDMVAKLPEIKTLVEDYRQQILNGEYEVCNALNPTAVCDPFISTGE
jgi:basic membrane protein A